MRQVSSNRILCESAPTVLWLDASAAGLAWLALGVFCAVVLALLAEVLARA
jgi:hypothetical protein